jgi:hypothetical protein
MAEPRRLRDPWGDINGGGSKANRDAIRAAIAKRFTFRTARKGLTIVDFVYEKFVEVFM